MTRLTTLLFVAFAAAGCITTSFQKGLVESRAKFDLDCEQIDVAELGNDTFGARGCGRRSTYIVICTGGSARTDLCNAVADTPQARQE